MNPAIFFDRDGVIIENVADYVRSWDDVQFLPGSLSTLAELAATPFRIVLVTNQAVVGRKIISLQQARDINDRIISEIEKAGGRVDGVYICPHAPEENCICRKPQPGLILQAAVDLEIDLSCSYLIGDALSDLEAGSRAGVAKNLLVRTGRGAVQAQLPAASRFTPLLIYESMANAVKEILAGKL